MNPISPINDARELEEALRAISDKEKVVQMQSYMKDHFQFLGVSASIRKEVTRAYCSDRKVVVGDGLMALISLLWQSPFREMQYLAIDILAKTYSKLDQSHLPFVEELIVTKSWWDTVDLLASNAVGQIFMRDRDLMKSKTQEWIDSDNMWLKRTAIICQLKFKDKVNEEMLYAYILKEIDNPEFFVQKACGWALRQYSKFNKESVIQFLGENPNLSNLCRREASKYLWQA